MDIQGHQCSHFPHCVAITECVAGWGIYVENKSTSHSSGGWQVHGEGPTPGENFFLHHPLADGRKIRGHTCHSKCSASPTCHMTFRHSPSHLLPGPTSQLCSTGDYIPHSAEPWGAHETIAGQTPSWMNYKTTNQTLSTYPLHTNMSEHLSSISVPPPNK